MRCIKTFNLKESEDFVEVILTNHMQDDDTLDGTRTKRKKSCNKRFLVSIKIIFIFHTNKEKKRRRRRGK